MALYSLFKIAALCTLFQAASAAPVARHLRLTAVSWVRLAGLAMLVSLGLLSPIVATVSCELNRPCYLPFESEFAFSSQGGALAHPISAGTAPDMLECIEQPPRIKPGTVFGLPCGQYEPGEHDLIFEGGTRKHRGEHAGEAARGKLIVDEWGGGVGVLLTDRGTGYFQQTARVHTAAIPTMPSRVCNFRLTVGPSVDGKGAPVDRLVLDNRGDNFTVVATPQGRSIIVKPPLPLCPRWPGPCPYRVYAIRESSEEVYDLDDYVIEMSDWPELACGSGGAGCKALAAGDPHIWHTGDHKHLASWWGTDKFTAHFNNVFCYGTRPDLTSPHHSECTVRTDLDFAYKGGAAHMLFVVRGTHQVLMALEVKLIDLATALLSAQEHGFALVQHVGPKLQNAFNRGELVLLSGVAPRQDMTAALGEDVRCAAKSLGHMAEAFKPGANNMLIEMQRHAREAAALLLQAVTATEDGTWKHTAGTLVSGVDLVSAGLKLIYTVGSGGDGTKSGDRPNPAGVFAAKQAFCRDVARVQRADSEVPSDSRVDCWAAENDLRGVRFRLAKPAAQGATEIFLVAVLCAAQRLELKKGSQLAFYAAASTEGVGELVSIGETPEFEPAAAAAADATLLPDGSPPLLRVELASGLAAHHGVNEELSTLLFRRGALVRVRIEGNVLLPPPPPPRPPEGTQLETASSVSKKPVATLRAMLVKQALPTDGVKKVLVARLTQHFELSGRWPEVTPAPPAAPAPPRQLLIAPGANEKLRTGGSSPSGTVACYDVDNDERLVVRHADLRLPKDAIRTNDVRSLLGEETLQRIPDCPSAREDGLHPCKVETRHGSSQSFSVSLVAAPNVIAVRQPVAELAWSVEVSTLHVGRGKNKETVFSDLQRTVDPRTLLLPHSDGLAHAPANLCGVEVEVELITPEDRPRSMQGRCTMQSPLDSNDTPVPGYVWQEDEDINHQREGYNRPLRYKHCFKWIAAATSGAAGHTVETFASELASGEAGPLHAHYHLVCGCTDDEPRDAQGTAPFDAQCPIYDSVRLAEPLGDSLSSALARGVCPDGSEAALEQTAADSTVPSLLAGMKFSAAPQGGDDPARHLNLVRDDATAQHATIQLSSPITLPEGSACYFEQPTKVPTTVSMLEIAKGVCAQKTHDTEELRVELQWLSATDGSGLLYLSADSEGHKLRAGQIGGHIHGRAWFYLRMATAKVHTRLNSCKGMATGACKLGWGISNAKQSMVAALLNMGGIPCRHPAQKGGGKGHPGFNAAQQMRGKECVKWINDILPGLKRILDPAEYWLFWVAAKAVHAMGMIDEDGYWLGQVRWYGGAPGATRVGKLAPISDTDNWPRLQSLYESLFAMAEGALRILFPGNKFLQTARSKLVLNKIHTPSSHNRVHTKGEIFQQLPLITEHMLEQGQTRRRQIGQELFKKDEHASVLRKEYRLDAAAWLVPLPQQRREQAAHQHQAWLTTYRNEEQRLQCDLHQWRCCTKDPLCDDHTTRFELREQPAPSFGPDAVNLECVAVPGGGCPSQRLMPPAQVVTHLEDRLGTWLANVPTNVVAGTQLVDLAEAIQMEDEETEEDVDEDEQAEGDEADTATGPVDDGSDAEDEHTGDDE